MTRGSSINSKLGVLILSGDPSRARALLEARFPQASIRLLKKEDLKYASARKRIDLIRSLKPDIFVFFGGDRDSLTGVGVPLLTLLGALSGSRLTWLVEQGGRYRVLPGRLGMVRAIPRLGLEIIGSIGLVVTVRAILPFLERRARQTAGAVGQEPETANGPLRIAYLRSIGYPRSSALGGTPSHTVGIVRALADIGNSVQVLSRSPIPVFDHPGVRVSRLPYAPTIFTLHPFVEIENHIRFTFKAWMLLRADPPNFLYQRHNRFDPSGPVLSIALRRPLMLEHEGSEELSAELAWSPTSELWSPISFRGTLRAFERLSHSAASSIFALSDEIRRDLVEERHVPVERVALTPSGVDATRFRPHSGGNEIRARLGIPPETIVVGFSGSFGPWHGIKTIISAARELPAAPPLHFLFVGDGDGRAEAQMLFEENGFPHESTFTGLVPLDAVAPYLDACNLLLCPTEPLPGGREFPGSPTKLFEYMAMGKAIVASAIGQIRNVIRDEENGLLIEPGSSESLSSAILRLAREPELRGRLGRRARQDALSDYSWEKNARAVLTRYARDASA